MPGAIVTSQSSKRNTWLDRTIPIRNINWEIILFSLIILAAIATRFYDLGVRAMSHDESLHAYYSWLYSKGAGYQYSPMMHGPLQFHLLALVFNLLGDSDFTARIPSTLASLASGIFIWQYRRYLGKAGTLITAGLFVISPYMLYYGRYVRNEALVVLFGIIGLWGILRYLDTGQNKYLYILSAAVAFHFTTKETALIYLAQTLIFLGLVLITQITKTPWRSTSYRKFFFVILIFVLFIVALGIGYAFVQKAQIVLIPEEINPPILPDTTWTESSVLPLLPPVTIGIILGGLVIFTASIFFLFKGYGSENLRKLRSFDLLILLGSLTIPHLSALPIRMLGWNPLNNNDTQTLLRVGIAVIVMIGLSALMGLWWKPKVWLMNNAIFYGIFILFFTSLFTNGAGFFTGMVGSLGHWLVQQGVGRGNQPLYYYALVQIPIYEYLAACGTLLAAGLGWRYFSSRRTNRLVKTQGSEENGEVAEPQRQSLQSQRRAFFLFGFWTFANLITYTIAGEKMPWLTVHITLPMLLLTGWALGHLVNRIKWSELMDENKWLALILIPLLMIILFGAFTILVSGERPFAGKTLDQLETTNSFLLFFLICALALWGLFRVLRSLDWRQIFSLSTLIFFALISIQTTKTAFRAAYVNFDQATEYLVYAHSTGGVRDVITRIEDISLRTTDSFSIEVAVDDDVTWPFKWYLRNYPNKRFYGSELTREIRSFPIILIGDNNFHKIAPIVGKSYDHFDYIRMWWPMQDYFNLTWEKFKQYFTNPDLRNGIFQIWLYRDYSAYGEAIGRDFSLPTWSPGDKMRMYIHNDLISALWDYGVGAYKEEVVIDPYANKEILLTPDTEIRWAEDGTNLFDAPRGISMAPDGSLFVADSKNNRIVHLKEGKVVNTWGKLSIPVDGHAPDGTFNEPWGIAVSPDGQYVYVADTWNHRIQKFTSKGEYITSWGYFGQTDDPYAFWGPRDIAIDSEENLYVSNTGNKRIHVFSPKGEYLEKFGSVGYALGQFDEPVGIAIEIESGLVFVADTWNQRIQAFQRKGPDDNIPVIVWDISGWYGKGLDNKPYLAIGPNGNLYATDPELSRVLVFRTDGEFIHFFGNYEIVDLGTPIGIISDGDKGIWISDSRNNRLLHFTLP
jgi:uncharacterized protein (TIGR03663 family)